MTVGATRTGIALALLSAASASMASAQRAATHSSNIWAVTFTRNEATVATVARGEVRIWTLPSGQLACRLDGSYYSARVAADGEAGYHITFLDYVNGRTRASRAVRVDPATCAQTPVALPTGAGGASRYSYEAPGEARVVVAPDGERYTIAVAGQVQLESADLPSAFEAGNTVYTCTTREQRGEFTYHRIDGDRRPEKLGSVKPNRYGAGACGQLSIMTDGADGAYLLDAAGTVVDVRRKRVLASYAMSQPTSVGLDMEAKVMIAGHGDGAVTVELGSGKPTARVGGSSMHGYVSPRATWVAIASSLIARPLVELQSRRFGTIVLDDARSRPAADVLDATRAAETEARLERGRREIAALEARRAAAAAERDRERAVLATSAQRFMRQIADDIGQAVDHGVLRHRGAQGGYETMEISLKQGDVLVLGSEEDGNVDYHLTDGTRVLRSIGRRALTSGRALTQTIVSQDIEGTLTVVAGRGPVWVFVVERKSRR